MTPPPKRPSDGLFFEGGDGEPAGGSGPTPGDEAARRPLTVSQLTAQLKRFIELHFGDVFVEGEISNLRPAASGHIYFVLKDAGATIGCVMWASDAARLLQPLREGDTVEVRGRISLYEPRGQYQIVVRAVRPAGVGKLFLAFQQMKERLQKEGLFEESRKRPIPQFPKCVGVVTSPTGAAIRDILNILTRRAPHLPVVIYPARVQGEGAAREIAHAIGRVNALELADVLIVGRGGGSLEDLWPFNEEIVARAIHASKIPVISAVGHEIDFTIADFVADLRAPTPSAAAELVARNSAELLREIGHLRTRLQAAMRPRLEQFREAGRLPERLHRALVRRLELMRSHLRRFEASYALQLPMHAVNEMRQRLDDIQPRLTRALEARQLDCHRRLERLDAHLGALNPKAILARGYSIIFAPDTAAVVRARRETHPGQLLHVVLHEGEIDVNVAGAPPAPRRSRVSKQETSSDWFGTDDAKTS